MFIGTESAKLLQLSSRLLKVVEEILRSRADQNSALRLNGLFLCTLICGVMYGAAMGTFTMHDWQRWPQIVYSAAKVPLLLLGAFTISLPSFYVFNLLLGLSQDFKVALRGLAATQSGLAIVLASLSPFTLFWYSSFVNYQAALAFNGFMFAMASISAQVLLRRHYGPLIAKNSRHRMMLAFWLMIYMLVAIQLAWLMRPFIGDPKRSPEFFRHDPFNNNAYVMVIKTAWRFLTDN